MTALEPITLSSRIAWYHEMHVNEHGKAAEHFAVEVHEDVLEDWVAVAAGLEAEVTRLREALVVERATAILLRDELEDYRPRVWPTRKEADFLRHTAYAELVAEKLLP